MNSRISGTMLAEFEITTENEWSLYLAQYV